MLKTSQNLGWSYVEKNVFPEDSSYKNDKKSVKFPQLGKGNDFIQQRAETQYANGLKDERNNGF